MIRHTSVATLDRPPMGRMALKFLVPTALLMGLACCNTASAQSSFYNSNDAARAQLRSRMQSMDAPSMVDRYRRDSIRQPTNTRQTNPTPFQPSRTRQVAWMQQADGIGAPPLAPDAITPGANQNLVVPNGMPGMPNSGALGAEALGPEALGPEANAAGPVNGGPNGPPLPDPNTNAPPAPRMLPGNMANNSALQNNGQPFNPNRNPNSPSDLRGNDLTPMVPPKLEGHGFATVNNCNLVSPPSGYSAASGIGCGSGMVSPVNYNAPGCNTPNPNFAPAYANPNFQAPPAQVPAPAVMPPAGLGTGGLVAGGFGSRIGTGAPPRALISLGQNLNTVQVGQGLWGQPVAYVPGQGIRNWIRYFFP